jgi:hypothetical protein
MFQEQNLITKLQKNTAIITGTLSVNSRNKMLISQCASKHEIIL